MPRSDNSGTSRRKKEAGRSHKQKTAAGLAAGTQAEMPHAAAAPAVEESDGGGSSSSALPVRQLAALRWYTPNPIATVIPYELVLHAGFEMEAAELPPRGASQTQRDAVERDAVVLADADHDATMAELSMRHEE